MRDQNQLLAVLIPFNRHARRIVVLDAHVDSDIKRLAADDRRMMRLIDAWIPHFGRDEYFLRRGPAVFMKPQICPGPKRLSLAVVVGLSLPRHSRFMVPIGKDARFTIAVDRQIGMEPLALAFGMLILADYLFVQIPEQSGLALESGIGRDETNRVLTRGNRCEFFP